METENKDRKAPFTVPDSFFEDMQERTLALIREEEDKKERHTRSQRLSWILGGGIGAVAAALALLLLLPSTRGGSSRDIVPEEFYGSVYTSSYGTAEDESLSEQDLEMERQEMELLLALYESDIFLQD